MIPGMKCPRPTCNGAELRIAERQGIEIDFCPVCRGVWLDRGELDKIIERSAEVYTAADGAADLTSLRRGEPEKRKRSTYEQRSTADDRRRYEDDRRRYRDDDDDDDDDDFRRRDRRRKRSFLSELFDIFD